MENVLTYILQVNLLLALVFVGYQFLLKNLTFYTINRVYFIVGSLYALIYPLIDLKKWLLEDAVVSVPIFWDYVPLQMVEYISYQYSVYDIILAGVAAGGIALIFKFFVQITSLLRIHYYSKEAKWHSYLFRDVIFPIVPFSFFNKIYIHRAQHQEVELNDIFEHENVHVKGLHTWDVLLFEILLVGCWYNPLVWLMRKAVRQNLEFLTDQQVLNKGIDRQTYQFSLLNVTQRGAVIDISNQFNFKILKKRIMMMNKKRSSHLELSKYAFLLPVIILAGASFTVSKAEKRIEEIVAVAKDTPLDVVLPKEVPSLTEETLSFSSNGIVSPNTDSVAFVLNGKLVSTAEVKKINAEDLESAILNLDNKLTKKYRKKAIINLVTKEFAGTVGTPSAFKSISFDENNRLLLGGKLDIHRGNKEKNQLSYSVSFDTVSRTVPPAVSSGKVVGIRAIKRDSIVTGNRINIVESLGNKLGDQPLFFLNNKEIIETDMLSLNPTNIKSITVIKDKDALSIYGEKGRNGVVMLETNGAVQSVRRRNQDTLRISYNGSGETMAINNSPSVRFRGTNISGTSPLIVLDGVEMPDGFGIQALDPNKIENISVYKDKAVMLEKYGSKADNGVIEITTKKSSTQSPKNVTVVGYGQTGSNAVKKEATQGNTKNVTVIGYGQPSSNTERKDSSKK